MNRIKLLAVITLAAVGLPTLSAQEQRREMEQPSPPAAVSSDIDGKRVKIACNRPGAGVIKMAWVKTQYSVAFANKK